MPQSKNDHSLFQSLFGSRNGLRPKHLLLVVVIHLLAWSAFFLLPLLIYPLRFNLSNFVERELLDKLMLVGFFYLFYYLLIPQLFERKKYTWFAFTVLISFATYMATLLQTHPNNVYVNRGPTFAGPSGKDVLNDSIKPGRGFRFSKTDRLPDEQLPRQLNIVIRETPFPDDSLGKWMPPEFFEEPGRLFGISKPVLAIVLNRASSSFFLILLLAGFIRLSFSFIRNQNEKKILENAQLNAEMDLLKSQINPHFLFNTLNSIYSQAHARSENTEYSILKLSELLRYVLYDSSSREVSLESDVQYIRNYIELQRLRLSNRITIDFKVQGDLNELKIAPMLLISFIENAFKHGISYSQASTIVIHLLIENKQLRMEVINPIVESDKTESGDRCGLGIPNVTRRLEILYPGRHQLSVRRENDKHYVQLNLKLAHD